MSEGGEREKEREGEKDEWMEIDGDNEEEKSLWRDCLRERGGRGGGGGGGGEREEARHVETVNIRILRVE